MLALVVLGSVSLASAVAPGLVIAARCALARAEPVAATPTATQVATAEIPGYSRPGSATYLTLPEWFIVYNTEEYTASIRNAPPSRFPYFGSILDFWSYYRHVCDASCGAFPFDAGNHVMLVVIGSSFTVENALKGLYENIVGRVVEAISGHDTEEDVFAARTAEEYGRFMHTTPWYEFPFGEKLTGLWRQTHAWGKHPLRKWERRLALSTEYTTKAAYAWLIRATTKATYGARIRARSSALNTCRRISRVCRSNACVPSGTAARSSPCNAMKRSPQRRWPSPREACGSWTSRATSRYS